MANVYTIDDLANCEGLQFNRNAKLQADTKAGEVEAFRGTYFKIPVILLKMSDGKTYMRAAGKNRGDQRGNDKRIRRKLKQLENKDG